MGGVGVGYGGYSFVGFFVVLCGFSGRIVVFCGFFSIGFCVGIGMLCFECYFFVFFELFVILFFMVIFFGLRFECFVVLCVGFSVGCGLF